MAEYENKLGEWFKQVEKIAEERSAKKKSIDVPLVNSAPAAEVRQQPVSAGTAVEIREPITRTVVHEDTDARVGEPRPIMQSERRQALFDDAGIPPVEDFFSFLNRTGEQERESDSESIYEVPSDQGTLKLSEGTGVPRPIEAAPIQPTAEPAIIQAPIARPEVLNANPVIHREVTDEQPSTQEKWDRLPRHLQTLFAGDAEEIAQKSYKTFKESRGNLIEHLLDPTISLEEAARILNVCPTTVRRYTNRGVLQHYRTAGNQRRFKLSDVLNFMENNSRDHTDASEEE